jgi:hypothetical protein
MSKKPIPIRKKVHGAFKKHCKRNSYVMSDKASDVLEDYLSGKGAKGVSCAGSFTGGADLPAQSNEEKNQKEK